MFKNPPTPELIERMLASVPEGFVHESMFNLQFKMRNKGRKHLQLAANQGRITFEGKWVIDLHRLTTAQAQALAVWCKPSLPIVETNYTVNQRPILEQRAARLAGFVENPVALRLIERLSAPGYTEQESFAQDVAEQITLTHLIDTKVFAVKERYVYDPLSLSATTMEALCRRDVLRPSYDVLVSMLEARSGKTAPLSEIPGLVGEYWAEILDMGGIDRLTMDTPGKTQVWVWLTSGSKDEAIIAIRKEMLRQRREERQRREVEWGEKLALCGEVLRVGATDGNTHRARVLARSYSAVMAAKRLQINEYTMKQAVRAHLLIPFIDPDHQRRYAAEQIERIVATPELSEAITAPEILSVRAVALVSRAPYSTARSRLERAQLSTTTPQWGQVRGKWGLPDTWRAFRALLKERKREWSEEREQYYAQLHQQMLENEAAERSRRKELRERVIAVFPSWEHERRADQRLVLHIGPTNSGKTHSALQRLAEAGSGWYLAPLRLLAFEVFERFNEQGIPCDLLTGEEYIATPGAQITASTIEMFNPTNSGACVLIDEAHMFADSDRGWAWTRALMEAQAPEIHILGAPIIRQLMERLAQTFAIPVEVIEHTRLSPLEVADQSWKLKQLPPRTILVAFSRKMVLALKAQLEEMGRRVSVVYGSLPPEVRRRQADRFASGETEICVATDAVGMGLNLPADQVCFYEVDKFDGQAVRDLTPNEVRQIGGRAGRYGYSQAGLVGALKPEDLSRLRKLFHAPSPPLRFARVAPTVEALELIPGTLAERLQEWAQLQSIPEALRGLLNTVDLSERIELAQMLRDSEVDQLGLASALRLINAPTRRETRRYWRQCATAILSEQKMPLPPTPPPVIRSDVDLSLTENSLLSADIYLWLRRRAEFGRYALDEEGVREMRRVWSMRVDDALVRKVDTSRRCRNCGRKLPLDSRHSICDACFELQRWGGGSARSYDEEE